MIIRKTITYSMINSAIDKNMIPVGKDLVASGTVSGVKIKIITPFISSDGTYATFGVGEAGFAQRFLTCDATAIGIYQTNGVELNDIWFMGDDASVTTLTAGITSDSTTLYTQGEALVSYEIDEEVVDL